MLVADAFCSSVMSNMMFGRSWFTLCLRCNIRLETPSPEDVRENVPEYVFHQNASATRFCPSCGRFFWPLNQVEIPPSKPPPPTALRTQSFLESLT